MMPILRSIRREGWKRRYLLAVPGVQGDHLPIGIKVHQLATIRAEALHLRHITQVVGQESGFSRSTHVPDVEFLPSPGENHQAAIHKSETIGARREHQAPDAARA